MINIKTAEEMEGMRRAGAVAATVKVRTAQAIAPGMTTQEIDLFAKNLIDEMGAVSAFKGYRGYPGYTCISVNEEVVHGIPGPRVIEIGDIVSLDVGVEFEGFIGDNATTVMVGVTDPEVIDLVRVSEESLAAAIAAAKPGNRLSDISHAVQKVAESAGYSIVREFVGHGIGRTMHEEPQIPNFGPPGRGPRLKEGMTLAIEPMVNLGAPEVEILADDWTVVTRDRKPSVHVEHTVAVKEGGGEILTLPLDL